MMQFVVDIPYAARLIQAMAPDWLWLLKYIESEDGYVRFPPVVAQWIKNLNVGNYPRLYEDERAIGAVLLRAFLPLEQIEALNAELELCSPDERGQLLLEYISNLGDGIDAIELPKTPAAQKLAETQFLAMSEEERQCSIEFAQRFLMGMLAGFYQSLSIMVHGEKLTALVAQAKAGDDKAFAKAVQIDKRILHALPYFNDRFAAANSEGQREFVELVTAHMSRPPYKGKIRHKALYLAFSLLDQLGVLSRMKHSELLDLCTQAGLDSHANRIDDVKNMSKRLAEYRAFRRRGRDLSTP
ncbi:hypothetical protein LJR189_002188 [Acidovorax delafieldii]|uniref:hypothetical protein n=1 Tax=Acidovorax delafieldii TaxID=47920 RepID=UPI003ECDA462